MHRHGDARLDEPDEVRALLRVHRDQDAEDPGAAFTAISQLGTEAAVLLYFWRDIVRIIRAWSASLAGRVPRTDPDALLGWWVIVGTIPIGVFGLIFSDQIESGARSLYLIGTMLIVLGLLLLLAVRS